MSNALLVDAYLTEGMVIFAFVPHLILDMMEIDLTDIPLLAFAHILVEI